MGFLGLVDGFGIEDGFGLMVLDYFSLVDGFV
jgi:hypothetical protein